MRRSRPGASRLWLVVLLATVAWSSRAFLDYGELLARLWGRSEIERGGIGSNIWQNFLARAGRPEQQRTYERLRQALGEAKSSGRPTMAASFDGRAVTIGSERDAPSAMADVWAWTRQAEMRLSLDAHVYLNAPSTLLYYYGNFMWYPRPVRISPEPALVKDDDTLARAWQRVSAADAPRLRQAGFTHVLAESPTGYRLIDLRRGD